MTLIMRRSIRLLPACLLVICVMLLSCGRNPTEVDIYDVVNGSWDWAFSYGGYAGEYVYPDSAGYHKTIHFGNDRVYTEAIDDSVVLDEKYEIVMRRTGDRPAYHLYIENQAIDLFIERVDTDTLTLRENCDDCYSHTYARLRPL